MAFGSNGNERQRLREAYTKADARLVLALAEMERHVKILPFDDFLKLANLAGRARTERDKAFLALEPFEYGSF
jgi:hypothetical protein